MQVVGGYMTSHSCQLSKKVWAPQCYTSISVICNWSRPDCIKILIAVIFVVFRPASWFCVLTVCVALPQSPILSRSSSRYDFGDEDAGVVAHMGIVCSPCYAEAQA